MLKIITVVLVAFGFTTLILEDCKKAKNVNRENRATETMSTPRAKIDIEKKSDAIFVNTAGWELPDLTKQNNPTSSKEFLNDEVGNKREVLVTNYVLKNSFTDEPFISIGEDHGRLKINIVREFKTGNNIFAYLLLAQKANSDKETDNIQTIGLSFFYAFVDTDGDGKFETLLKNPEKDLAIPKWAL